MPANRSTYVKNILIPCLVFSTAAGAGTGILIFLFKWAASSVIGLSSSVYDTVREHPAYFPFLLLGALLLGLTASFVLRKVPDCRGGDRLHVHYQTYDPEETLAVLEALVGEQGDIRARIHTGDEHQQVPEV